MSNYYSFDGGRTSGAPWCPISQGLASAAGVATENARLYEQVRRREAALAAMRAVANALVAESAPEESLRLVARHARELVGADVATIALPEEMGDTLTLQGRLAPGSHR